MISFLYLQVFYLLVKNGSFVIGKLRLPNIEIVLMSWVSIRTNSFLPVRDPRGSDFLHMNHLRANEISAVYPQTHPSIVLKP